MAGSGGMRRLPRMIRTIFIGIACISLGCFFFVCAYQVGHKNIGMGYLIFLGIFSICATPVLIILATQDVPKNGRGDYRGPGGGYGGGPGSMDYDADADADYDID
jgi:hypothetical protein